MLVIATPLPAIEVEITRWKGAVEVGRAVSDVQGKLRWLSRQWALCKALLQAAQARAGVHTQKLGVFISSIAPLSPPVTTTACPCSFCVPPLSRYGNVTTVYKVWNMPVPWSQPGPGWRVGRPIASFCLWWLSCHFSWVPSNHRAAFVPQLSSCFLESDSSFLYSVQLLWDFSGVRISRSFSLLRSRPFMDTPVAYWFPCGWTLMWFPVWGC